MHFSLVTRQGYLSLLLGFRASYQGEPGTGVEATGLLPFAALSSPVTRIDGGSFNRKRRAPFYIFISTLVFSYRQPSKE